MPQVSVIVPVYNAEKYLAECVDSILAQTLRDIEVILVDDGSTDTSPAICDAYAGKDSRVKVIHKANGRAASARNAGMKIVQGEYVAFVDSDDWISPDMYEQMLAAGGYHPLCHLRQSVGGRRGWCDCSHGQRRLCGRYRGTAARRGKNEAAVGKL